MKLEFKDKDFNEYEFFSPIGAADAANRRLREMLAECPMVYGSNIRPIDGWNENWYESTTHKGILVNVEPIKKPKCEHDAVGVSPNFDFAPGCAVLITHWKCSKCGVKLKPKAMWEEV